MKFSSQFKAQDLRRVAPTCCKLRLRALKPGKPLSPAIGWLGFMGVPGAQLILASIAWRQIPRFLNP